MALFRKKSYSAAAHAMLKDIVVTQPDADRGLALYVALLATHRECVTVPR